MAERLERRTQFSTVDTAAISRVPDQFSPFQALHVPVRQKIWPTAFLTCVSLQDVDDVEIPKIITAAL